jgi:hypothetical protein
MRSVARSNYTEAKRSNLFQQSSTSIVRHTDAGWSSSVARWAHNPEVVGSNPAPATNHNDDFAIFAFK